MATILSKLDRYREVWPDSLKIIANEVNEISIAIVGLYLQQLYVEVMRNSTSPLKK